jgi:RecA/RadA recombinase
MILNPEKVANTAKAAGIDPKIVAKNLFIQTAYDSQHQLQIAKEVGQLLEDNHDIKLVVINNLTKFFRDSNVRDSGSEIAKQRERSYINY